MSTPGWGQPAAPQQQPKKGGGCLKVGCLSIVGFVVVAGITSAIVSHGGTGTSSSPANTTTAATTTGQAAAPAPTSAPTSAAPVQAPAAPHVVLSTSGNGIKNTTQFTTGDSWTIKYSYDCSQFGGQGNFQVYVDYPDGDVPVNELGASGSDSSTETGAGTHTLKISSECRWTVQVLNG